MNEITKKNIIEYNPLALAWIGDSVHTLFVRERLISKFNLSANSLHLKASKFCRATFQSQALDKIFPILTEEEKVIAKRARNHKTHAVKNSSKQDYQKATAFEAVIGYLFLLGERERAKNLMEISMEEEK